MATLFERAFVSFHKAAYRLSGGRLMGSMRGAPILLLTTTGRKSRKWRSTPLAYVPEGDSYVLMASNAGRPSHPAWYLNLRQEPAATIRVKTRTLPVRAETLGSEERARLWQRLREMSPFPDEYQSKTSRVIPLIRLTERPS